ncbi:hypothetical protein ambt_01780 [Alteromonas naphthalenivorans]|jgi:hypothetical protein|uniref:Uncharacterized protein n=1 Tax=Alteromonas naphthalenivorans TaxID=715451 RepID=F5ZAE0_ALTNA|nr:hypothetical protein ambt_01780 [Alteromonas naphthalenivorans]
MKTLLNVYFTMYLEDKSDGTNKHKPSNMTVVPHVSTSKISGLMFASLSQLRNEVGAFFYRYGLNAVTAWRLDC